MTKDELEVVKSLVEKLPKYVDCNRKVRVGVFNSNPSLTEQHHKESCDINNIVKQYTLAGYCSDDFRSLSDRVFEDASKFIDNTKAPRSLQESYDLMEQAKGSFVQYIPSSVREMFDNDPLKFYNFASNLKNRDQLRALFSDVKTFNAPSVDQMEAGSHEAPVVNKTDDTK